MTATVILNNFKAPDLWRNKYRRSTYELWDANLHHGDVRPFACPTKICDAIYNQLFVVDGCECGGFASTEPVVKGFCEDAYYKLVGGQLKQATTIELCNGSSLYHAGAPVPEQISNVNVADCDSCDNTGVSYVITYVVDHAGVQIESSPSSPTLVVASPGNIPNATVTWGPAAFFAVNHNIVATRLYRTETTFEDGTDSIPPEGAEFVFVQEFAGSGGQTFLDDVPSHQTGGPLLTYEPMTYPAPPSGIIGLARTADGIVVAEKHRLFISEPGKPMFSFDGVVQIEDEIQAITAINNTIFVFTNNKPVKIGYRHTDGVMSIDRQVVDRHLPLKSIKSLSTYGNKVFFASTYSLYYWDTGGYGSDIKPAITPLLTPEQWINVDASSVVGTAYEFGYIMSSNTIDYSLMIEFGGDGTDTVNQTSVVPISYINPIAFGLDGDGHIVYSDGTGTYKWDWRRYDGALAYNVQDNVRPRLQDQCECCPWKLTMYFDNEGKNRFSKMRVEWDEQSATHLDGKFYLKAFGNETELTDGLKIISSRGFSIPKFQSSQTFCVEVSGCGIMHEIRLATSMQELVSNSNNLIGNPAEE